MCKLPEVQCTYFFVVLRVAECMSVRCLCCGRSHDIMRACACACVCVRVRVRVCVCEGGRISFISSAKCNVRILFIVVTYSQN